MQNSKQEQEDFNPHQTLRVGAKYALFGVAYLLTGSVHGLKFGVEILHEQLDKLTNRLDPREPKTVVALIEERKEPRFSDDTLCTGDLEVPQVDIGSGLIEESDLDQPVDSHEEQSTQSEAGVTSTPHNVVNLGQEVKRVIEETAGQEPKTIGDLIKKQFDNH